MRHWNEIELDGIDLLLVIAIGVLLVVILVLLLPVLWSWCISAIKSVPHWPWWVWSAICLAGLTVTLILRARYE